MYLRWHVVELVQAAPDPFDLLHHMFCLVHPITDIPLEGVVLVRELGRGGGSGSLDWPRCTVRIVLTTLLIPQKATPVPSVPLGLRGSLSFCFPLGTLVGAWWS
jgi:hypothetical protein